MDLCSSTDVETTPQAGIRLRAETTDKEDEISERKK
jgi:hypothetical protein